MPTGDPAPADIVAQLLPERHAWTEPPSAEVLKTLPNTPALFLLETHDAAPVLLATTQQLRRYLIARLVEAPQTARARANLAEVTRAVRWRELAGAFDARWWYFRAARQLYPARYRKLIGFGPAWFLHVDHHAHATEIRVTERVWTLPGEFIGPWPSHTAAQRALTSLWDLFDLCRYPEQVRKAPHGVRCAYAEMGRCDAPCDGGAPLERYAARVRAAWTFARGDTAEYLEQTGARMRTFAAAQQFEQAAQAREQLAVAEKWHGVLPAESKAFMGGGLLIALRATRRKAWKCYVFVRGELHDGPIVREKNAAAEALAWMRALDSQSAPLASADERMEQAWLVAQLLSSSAAEIAVILPADPSDNCAWVAAFEARVAAAHAARRKTTQNPPAESAS